TGEGCDEVLGGYRRYVAERAGWSVRAYRGVLSAAQRDKLSVLNMNGSASGMNRSTAGMNRSTAGANGSAAGVNGARGGPPFDADPRSSKLRRMFYFDQTGRLPDDLLERGD